MSNCSRGDGIIKLVCCGVMVIECWLFEWTRSGREKSKEEFIKTTDLRDGIMEGGHGCGRLTRKKISKKIAGLLRDGCGVLIV